MDTYDFLVEHDKAAGRFLLTAKTDRGRDWLDEFATASSEWWGKSLIVARWQIDHVVDLILAKGMEIYHV
jgi:hypothetical protein